MIIDTLAHAEDYASIHPAMREAVELFRRADTLTPGRHELSGGAYANVVTLETSAMDAPFEAHRRFIDVQYVFSGSEALIYAPTETLCVNTPYQEASDCELLDGKGNRARVPSGTFYVLFPQDAHAPCRADGLPARVRKVIAKLPVEGA